MQTVGRDSYVYTQLEALYARRVFPCIDEPDSKVPWQLTIDVPKGNIAVSNTPVVRESVQNGMRRFEFVGDTSRKFSSWFSSTTSSTGSA